MSGHGIAVPSSDRRCGVRGMNDSGSSVALLQFLQVPHFFWGGGAGENIQYTKVENDFFPFTCLFQVSVQGLKN